MKNVIITSVDLKYGDFLINHWLKSLKTNVNLKNIDIAVVDYGLNSSQKEILMKEEVILIKGTSKGNVGTARFIDMVNFLKNNLYDQILSIDGGDIIFQEDISSLFNTDKNYYRAVGHDLQNLFLESFIKNNFDDKVEKEIWNKLKNIPIEKTINAGVILAPYDKFIALCEQIDKLAINRNSYGPDQIVINYVAHRDGIKFLEKKYNFMVGNKEKFIVKNGVFYDEDLKKVAVVHNPGHLDTRVIKDFGYGENYNKKINFFMFYSRKFLYTYVTPIIKKIILFIN